MRYMQAVFVLGFLLAASPNLFSQEKPPAAPTPKQLKKPTGNLDSPRYEGDAPGWNWVYQSIAHGQSFKANGKTIASLDLRVAKLNQNTPEADLEVEIRDRQMKKVFARGFVSRMGLEMKFNWRKVELKQTVALKPGESYILLFHSQDTSNTNPWVVNQIYTDIYPNGSERFAKHHDYFFRLCFKEGTRIHVGPAMDAAPVVPISSGSSGGVVRGPLTLQGFGPVPPAVTPQKGSPRRLPDQTPQNRRILPPGR